MEYKWKIKRVLKFIYFSKYFIDRQTDALIFEDFLLFLYFRFITFFFYKKKNLGLSIFSYTLIFHFISTHYSVRIREKKVFSSTANWKVMFVTLFE